VVPTVPFRPNAHPKILIFSVIARSASDEAIRCEQNCVPLTPASGGIFNLTLRLRSGQALSPSGEGTNTSRIYVRGIRITIKVVAFLVKKLESWKVRRLKGYTRSGKFTRLWRADRATRGDRRLPVSRQEDVGAEPKLHLNSNLRGVISLQGELQGRAICYLIKN
jgi:hypothetical protein